MSFLIINKGLEYLYLKCNDVDYFFQGMVKYESHSDWCGNILKSLYF